MEIRRDRILAELQQKEVMHGAARQLLHHMALHQSELDGVKGHLYISVWSYSMDLEFHPMWDSEKEERKDFSPEERAKIIRWVSKMIQYLWWDQNADNLDKHLPSEPWKFQSFGGTYVLEKNFKDMILTRREESYTIHADILVKLMGAQRESCRIEKYTETIEVTRFRSICGHDAPEEITVEV